MSAISNRPYQGASSDLSTVSGFFREPLLTGVFHPVHNKSSPAAVRQESQEAVTFWSNVSGTSNRTTSKVT